MNYNREEYLHLLKTEYSKEYYEKALFEEYVANIRCLVYMAFKRKRYKKNTKTHKILGCSFDELHSHLEKQFIKGMSWENKHKWHVDHIVPLYKARTYDEVIKLSHYTNLQAIWKKENLVKNKKLYPVTNLHYNESYV